MSTFFLADRIKELSRTETAGPIVLDGAAPGFSSFDDFFASGDVVFYAITDNKDYEVGSGIYGPNASDRVITRFPIRSSKLNSGPYYVNGDEANGPAGYYYPLYLTRSAAQSGVGFSDGPYTNVTEKTFTEFPGITFYSPSEHQGYSPSAGASGSDYNALSTPVDFDGGVKEVFVTYPGKTAVLTGFGLDADTKEPKTSGVAFWHNESILNYSNQLVWDDTNNFLGIAQLNPEFALDIGGEPQFSIVRASGFMEGGSGISFSGGAITYTGATASGGVQYEPFLRNENGSGSQGIIEFSGVVNQYIGISKQTPGTVFAGPQVDYCGPGPCPPDYPNFRLLTIDDIPLADLTSSGGFVIQNNAGIDGQSSNVSPNNYVLGMVAIYANSGQITYDSGILFDYSNNRLLVGGDASTDTPSYTLDARGTLGSQSGYFNQLIFTDDLIRVGDNAGTNDGNVTENFYVIAIGNNAGAGASGWFDSLAIGRSAGLDATECSGLVLLGRSAGTTASNVEETFVGGTQAAQGSSGVQSGVLIGTLSGSGLVDSIRVIAIGTQAGQSASGITNTTILGVNAGDTVSGVTNTVLIGPNASYNGSGLLNVVALGNNVIKDSYDLNQIVAIGLEAGNASESGTQVVWIGTNAGENSTNLNNVIAIGSNAAKAASGLNSTYIGGEAGHGASGDGNIELTNNGTALAGTVSNKINLGGVIQGDVASNKLSLGLPSGLDPIATLTVEPANVDDAAFLIRVVDSGSATPPVQLQSGDGTVLYEITNSGDVRHNGWAQPSGGLWLPDADPTRDSGVGGFMLWNNGNTLIWNGSPVSGENAFTSWTFRTEGNTGTITDGQEVQISGISGIQVIASGAGNRNWTVDGGTLSGLIVELSGQIVASNYDFTTFASGVGSNNNDPKLMEAGAVLAFSGVSGINFDFTDLTDGTNSSGIYTIGYDITNTYSFNVTNGDVANDVITNTETVTISGVSGVRVEFEDVAGGGFFRIGASGLSGVLQSGIDNNTALLSNEFGVIDVSGVSGIAVYASGQVDNITLLGATSGLIQQDGKYIMDPLGSGSLSQLNYPDGSIVIRERNYHEDPSLRHYRGGTNSNVVFIGSGCGAFESQQQNRVVAIGAGAFGGNGSGLGDRTSMTIIGNYAFDVAPDMNSQYSIAIGYQSLSSCSGWHNIGIGYGAGRQSIIDFWGGDQNTRTSEYTIDLGYEAGAFADYTTGNNVNIGYRAGKFSASGVSNISIGQNAGGGNTGATFLNISNEHQISIGHRSGYGSKKLNRGINLGYDAGYLASGHNYSIFIGDSAGYGTSGSTLGDLQGNAIAIGKSALHGSSDVEQTIAIGDQAGSSASGVEHSVFIGRYAGWKRSSVTSIIISNQSAIPTEGYDAGWSAHSEDSILDIGHTIQGKINPGTVNLHVGSELNSSYRTLNDIQVSTFSITPDANTDSALVLWLRSNNGTFSTQAAGLMKTQTKNGSTIQPTLNEIINEHGFLRLPRATGVTGTYPNKILLADGQGVFAGPGVMAVYEFSPTDRGLAVSLNDGGAYAWYKIPITTIL